MKIKRGLNKTGILFLLGLLLNSCNKNNSEIAGTYKYFNEDMLVMRMMNGQNTYLQLKDNNTIIYHTEINGKKSFNHEGTFAYDEKSNMLNIKWNSGKVPGHLKIEKSGDNYFIKIGSTLYKK